jgi:Leucine-rich repeat (LRR) protein
MVLINRNFLKIEFGPKLKDFSTLNLENKEITGIEANTFCDCSSLKELDLQRNRIETLETIAFTQLAKLTSLRLNSNQIVFLDVNTFKECSSLKKLILSENKIERIDPDGFKGLSSLSELNLDNNCLSEFSLLSKNLWNLKKLVLSSNKIEKLVDLSNSLPTAAVANPVVINFYSAHRVKNICQLQELHLNDNLIGELSANTFQVLVNLKKLFLNGNRIEKVDDGVLSGLAKLEELYLHNNWITSIEPRSSFNDLHAIKLISLYDNKTSFKSFVRDNYLVGSQNECMLPTWQSELIKKACATRFIEFLSQFDVLPDSSRAGAVQQQQHQQQNLVNGIKNEDVLIPAIADVNCKPFIRKLGPNPVYGRLIDFKNMRLELGNIL